jgi:hypothetical protein
MYVYMYNIYIIIYIYKIFKTTVPFLQL